MENGFHIVLSKKWDHFLLHGIKTGEKKIGISGSVSSWSVARPCISLTESVTAVSDKLHITWQMWEALVWGSLHGASSVCLSLPLERPVKVRRGNKNIFTLVFISSQFKVAVLKTKSVEGSCALLVSHFTLFEESNFRWENKIVSYDPVWWLNIK